MICSLQNHNLPARYESWQFPPKKYLVLHSRFLSFSVETTQISKKPGHQHWQRKWQLKQNRLRQTKVCDLHIVELALRMWPRVVGFCHHGWGGSFWPSLKLTVTQGHKHRLTQASNFQMTLDVCLKEGETPPRPKTYKWNSHPSLMMVGPRFFFARDFA